MAKYFASEVSVEVSTDAVQIFGGYGYTKDFPVEKFYRDSKLCTIGEGTSEIQKLVISRELFKYNVVLKLFIVIYLCQSKFEYRNTIRYVDNSIKRRRKY